MTGRSFASHGDWEVIHLDTSGVINGARCCWRAGAHVDHTPVQTGCVCGGKVCFVVMRWGTD